MSFVVRLHAAAVKDAEGTAMTIFQRLLRTLFCTGIITSFAYGQAAKPMPANEEGIPVTDALVIAKCGTCHKSDDKGNLQRVSYRRTTPEGWQDTLRGMILGQGVMVSPEEARSIVKYLSDTHGLTPEEAKPVMYLAERRVHDESSMANENLRNACAKCHTLARSLSMRRSVSDWKQLADSHAARFKAGPNSEAIAYLSKTAALQTPEWTAWNSRVSEQSVIGRWLVTAYLPGHGMYYGQMEIQTAGGGQGELSSRVKLQSLKDGSSVIRTGRSVLYGGYAWRGRSKGVESPGTSPDDLASDAREAVWFSSDGTRGEGRWYWGPYQEFGFDVRLQRATSDMQVMGVEGWSLKAGTQNNIVQIVGNNFPRQVTAADLDFGPGITVRRLASRVIELVAEVEVKPDAPPGKREIHFQKTALPATVTVYDRVDYLKVLPDTALAAFADKEHTRGYRQFEAIGYQRGADGKKNTADDLEVGPVEATWSTEVFYATDPGKSSLVGSVNADGLYTPAAENPQANSDVWVIATAKNEKDTTGKALVGKGYLVVTIPVYIFQGRRYIRDLDRWVDDGKADSSQGTAQQTDPRSQQ